ncbi:hypothetical protein M9H77_11651 [Catharanthus roseus]|uniref:Uncharacterized protein n=1 Tax=Catharanthus roseus TaxID=4058 RepID=A0ACC0BF64_CATRO|nr:hypothetical protein M9H77_11651 [Catharanthus roseus]
MLESFLRQQRRRKSEQGQSSTSTTTSIVKFCRLLDSYLHVVAKEVVDVPVQKLVSSLAAAVPEIARPQHDQLYKAINIYLKEHPNLTKPDKKELCRILDCQKLSQKVRSHVLRNEQLPLRTVVQVLFFEPEKLSQEEPSLGRQRQRQYMPPSSTGTADLSNSKSRATTSASASATEGGSGEVVHHHRLKRREEREKKILIKERKSDRRE